MGLDKYRDSKGRFIKGIPNPNKKPIIKTTCACGKIFEQPDVKYKQIYCSNSCRGKYTGAKNLIGVNIGRKQSPELIEKRRLAIIKGTPTGMKSKNWKGGYRNTMGYVIIKIDGISHQLHRWIFEKVHNTKIPKGYDIHHIDLNKKNNKISNLQCIKHTDHVKLHWDIKNGVEY